MMDKELTREMEKKAMELALKVSGNSHCANDDLALAGRQLFNIEVREISEALSETYTRAQSDLAKKILGVVKEKSQDNPNGSLAIHGVVVGHNTARAAILQILQDSGVEIEKETV